MFICSLLSKIKIPQSVEMFNGVGTCSQESLANFLCFCLVLLCSSNGYLTKNFSPMGQ